MTYRIVLRKGAGGSSFSSRCTPLTDADDKLMVFQTYEDAVTKCEYLNSRLVDRNLRYSVERRLIS